MVWVTVKLPVEFLVPNPLPLRIEPFKKEISTLMYSHSIGQRHSESTATKKSKG